MTLYAHNGSYDVGGLGLLHAGAHDGDWEHLTARIDPESGDLLGLWYAAHRPQDGQWVEAGRVPRGAGGRPLAYVALHGHGVYPQVRGVGARAAVWAVCVYESRVVLPGVMALLLALPGAAIHLK